MVDFTNFNTQGNEGVIEVCVCVGMPPVALHVMKDVCELP